MTTATGQTWNQRYENLHATEITKDQEFHHWLLRWAELEAEIYEHGTALTRTFQADTTDADARRTRQEFLTRQAPGLRAQHDRTAHQAVELSQQFAVPEDWRQVFLYLKVMARHALQPSGELEGQADVLAGEITTLFAQQAYELDGRPVSAQELGTLAVSPDRTQRQAASLSVGAALRRIAPEVVTRYGVSLELRREIAQRSGEATVHSHIWNLLERFDYTPAQVRQFRSDVRTWLSPLLMEFREKRRVLLGVEQLRAWDLAVDPFGASVTPRFSWEQEVVRQAARALAPTLPGLSEQVVQLYEEGYLDLTPRPGKAARSYTDYLAHRHKPYVQMSLQSSPASYQILFHELGHVAQLTGVAPGSPFWHFFPGVEMREFVAQVFELWSLDHLDQFFKFENADLHRVRFYEQTLSRMTAQCVMDEFQEWFYTTSEQITQARLEEVWQAISDQYPTGLDRGEEPRPTPLGYLSQQLVRRPLVGIEYALAWGWAFSFMEGVRADAPRAFAHLAEALRLGNTRPLPDLLKVAGVSFSFSPEQLRRLNTTMRGALLSVDAHSAPTGLSKVTP